MIRIGHLRHGRLFAMRSVLAILPLCCSPSFLQGAVDDVKAAERNRIETIAKAKQACISVFGPAGSGGGSGVVISPDGYALSNFHVVQPSGDHMKCSMPDGNLYDAVVVGIDPTGDVALIKLLGRDDFPTAKMGDSDQLRPGHWCFAVGNPFLLATDLQPTVTYGIVSGVHRYQYPAGTLLEYADCIQTDASVNPGNSGGPLFDAAGKLVGINGRCSFEKRGRVNVGVAYAISINQIKNFLGYLHSGRIVDHATLGATVASDEDGRVLVSNILESSDAYRRGLRADDEVISFGGRAIDSVNQFKNVLGIFPRGWRIPLSFRRQGQRSDILVRLTGVHSQEELIQRLQNPGRIPIPPQPDEQPDRQPQEPKPDQPRRPAPHLPGMKPKPKMPEHVANWYERRRGYSNYFFNLHNRQRVWESFASHGRFEDQTGEWIIESSLGIGNNVRFILRDEDAFAEFPMSREHVSLEGELDSQRAPEGSGGLLLALSIWRRFLTLGPERFGDVYYLGTAPLAGHEPLADVLVATYDVIETRFYFDVETGHLQAMEMFPDSGVDPCELFFEDYQSVQGRSLPRRVTVRYGDSTYGQIQIQDYQLPAQSVTDA